MMTREKIVELFQRLRKRFVQRNTDTRRARLIDSKAEPRHPCETDTEVTDLEETSDEKLLIIMNGFSGLAHYWHEFTKGLPDSQIIAGFIMAMTTFMQEVTGSAAQIWKTEYGNDITLLIVRGDWTIGVLAVSKITDRTTENLKRVIEEFEDNYSTLRYSDDTRSSAFNEFDEYVREVFMLEMLDEHTVIWKTKRWSERMPKFDKPSTTYKMMKFLLSVSSGMSLQEISWANDMPLVDVKELASIARWYGAIITNKVHHS